MIVRKNISLTTTYLAANRIRDNLEAGDVLFLVLVFCYDHRTPLSTQRFVRWKPHPLCSPFRPHPRTQWPERGCELDFLVLCSITCYFSNKRERVNWLSVIDPMPEPLFPVCENKKSDHFSDDRINDSGHKNCILFSFTCIRSMRDDRFIYL